MNRSRARVTRIVVAVGALLAGLGVAAPAAQAVPAPRAAPAPAPFVIIMMENHGLHPYSHYSVLAGTGPWP